MRINRLIQTVSTSPDTSPPPGRTPASDVARVGVGALSKPVEVVIYAEDCVLGGCIGLTSDRLSDMLNDVESFELIGVRVDDLAGGPAFELPTVDVNRDEVLLVHAGGPRGNPGRRHRTRQLPIEAKSGPFSIRGYVHSLPGTDAIGNLRRRPRMFAITDAIVEYTVQSRPQERRAGVLIVNREAIDWIVEGHDDQIVMPEIPVETGGARVKDFTGEVFELDADWNG